MNIRLDIEYDGSLYCGWQIQPKDITVQGEIEKALKTILRSNIKITGAGRTDSGVHASNQVANFKIDKIPLELTNLKFSLNGLLKDGIVIKGISEVDTDFHSRYSAKSRTYIYSVSKVKKAINRRTFYHLRFDVNINLMRKATKKLLGTHDFINLSVATGEKSTICNLTTLDITETDEEIYFKFSANRYLHKMVRLTVGLLIDIGRGKVDINEIDKILSPPIPKKIGFAAPPHGLCLVKIEY